MNYSAVAFLKLSMNF